MTDFEERVEACKEMLREAVRDYDPCVWAVAMRELAVDRANRSARYAYREHHKQENKSEPEPDPPNIWGCSECGFRNRYVSYCVNCGTSWDDQ